MKHSLIFAALLSVLPLAQAATLDLGQGFWLSGPDDYAGLSGSIDTDGLISFYSGFNGMGDSQVSLNSATPFSIDGLSASAFYQFDPVTITGYNDQGAVGQYTVSADCCWDISHPQIQFSNITRLEFSGFLQVYGSLTPVPEPETWAMLAAGLGISALAARRRRRA